MLRGIALFRGLNQEELEILADMCGIWETMDGQYIFKEGDKSEILYAIIEGKVDVLFSAGIISNRKTGELQPGQVFGEMSMIDAEKRLASVRCTQDCRLLSLTIDDFKRLGKSHPHIHLTIYKNISRETSRRLRSAEIRLREITGKNKKIEYLCPSEDIII